MSVFDLSPLWISLRTSAIATLITFFLGIAAARWMLDHRSRWRGLIDGLLISPLVLPPTVVGFLLLLLLGQTSPVGRFLSHIGILVTFTGSAAIITATVVAFPIMYRTSLSAFEQIDPNLIRVARTLGASEWIIVWQIMLPLAFRGIVAATILSFARALGEFGATLMLAGNIPGQTQTMPVAIFFAAEAGDFEQAMIWVLIILAISLSVIWMANYWAKDVYQKSSPKSKPSKRAIARSKINDAVVPVREAELVVDLQKQLASFPLDLSFSGNSHALGILGASGSGKSILLRCIAGLETPDRGYIRLNGRTLFDSSQGINLPSRDRRIGFVFQNYALFPHLTVAQNIAFGLRSHVKPERGSFGVARSAKRKIAAQLHQLHLEGLEHRYPHQLSGGQQQRVALARALAGDPEALLLDEPFSALDTYLRSQLEQQMVVRLADYNGATLFVTHNLEEAYRICPRLMVIDNGSAIAQGTKQAIFEHPETYTVAQLTGCKNFSRATVESINVVHAIDWGVHLTVVESIPDRLAYVGIRAHQFVIFPDTFQPNTFPCWLSKTSETPHRMTIFLKFNSPPTGAEDYHVQAEVFKEKWFTLKDRSFPWQVQLDPVRLILMRSN